MNLTATTVALARCPSYEEKALAATLEQLLPPLLPESSLRTAHVLLKPNLISVKMGPLACTEARFIVAVADWFRAQGAMVALGDSPAFGSATNGLRKLGILTALQHRGVQVRDFTRVRTVALPSGRSAGLAAEALECDFLVNMPRIKAHAQLRVTMAVKNCFGCLVGMRKPWWHMRHGGPHGNFAELVVELLTLLPPGVSLVDGVVAMDQSGPIKGREYPLGLVAGSLNPVAVDTALLHILGIDYRKVPLWWACKHAGLGGLELKELTFPLLRPEDVAVSDFQVPTNLGPIRFNPFRFLRNTLKRLLAA